MVIRMLSGVFIVAIPLLTSAPVTIIPDGSIRKPRLHWMGQLVEPVRLMNDMKNMGIEIKAMDCGPTDLIDFND